jgi:hypothetical protein
VNNGKDDVDFANNWDEIKLYKYNNKEYIGIRMLFSPCTGLGCSVNYYLIYATSTKTKNFFGTFGTNSELELYNYSNDNKLDYVSQTFKGDINNSKSIETIYELYSLETDGKFKELKNNDNKTYQIYHKIYTEGNKEDKLTEKWITKIK